MRNMKILAIILTISFLVSCAPNKPVTPNKPVAPDQPVAPTRVLDNLLARYPKYRIDDKLQNISIIGGGEGKNEITNFLTKTITDWTNIKVIEPGNLQAILGGKIIEYYTGLSQSDSQALSQMLQIDHILLFDEKISPYSDYKHGGRFFVRIDLKIVNTLSGEIIYQTTHSFGEYIDLTKSSYKFMKEAPASIINSFRIGCLSYLSHELIYATGSFFVGIRFRRDNLSIMHVMKDSLADRAGVQKGDRIIEVNGIIVHSETDLNALPKNMKQGDKIRGKIEREGKILEFNYTIPKIPFRPEEEKKEKSIKQIL